MVCPAKGVVTGKDAVIKLVDGLILTHHKLHMVDGMIIVVSKEAAIYGRK